nr:MobQ family relaxase [Rhodanobacter sp. B04]
MYHASIKTISRTDGHSAVGAAAYRAGLDLADEATGELHTYARRGGVVESVMFAPDGSPAWANDPAKLWNAAELAENRKNSTVAREFEVSLPYELTADQRQALVADLGQTLVARYGFAVQASTHAPHRSDADERNHHVHILATTRRMTPAGLGEKTRELDGGPKGREEIKAVRELIGERINHHLELAGHGERVDHRSLADQSTAAKARGDLTAAALLAREPTQHEGKAATAGKRAGREMDRVTVNADIKQANRDALAAHIRTVRAEGRVLEPVPGQQTQARHDANKEKRPVGVRGHERALPNGNTTSVRPHERLARVSVPTPAGGKVNLGSAGATGEKAKAAMETERHLNAWLAELAASGRKIAKQTEDVLRALAHTPRGTPAAPGHAEGGGGFKHWLRDHAKTMEEHERAKSRPARRVAAYEAAIGETDRRAHRLHRWDAANPEPAAKWWNPSDKRQWAERRRKRSDPLERQQARRDEARSLATDPNHLRTYEQQTEAVMKRLRQQETDRAATWPMAGLDFEIEFGQDVPGLVSLRDLNAEPKPGEPDPVKRAKSGTSAQVRPRPRPQPR